MIIYHEIRKVREDYVSLKHNNSPQPPLSDVEKQTVESPP